MDDIKQDISALEDEMGQVVKKKSEYEQNITISEWWKL
jgi:hypothetical protein